MTTLFFVSVGLLTLCLVWELFSLYAQYDASGKMYNDGLIDYTVFAKLFDSYLKGAKTDTSIVSAAIVWFYLLLVGASSLIGYLLGTMFVFMHTHPTSLVAVFSVLYGWWVWYNNTGDQVSA